MLAVRRMVEKAPVLKEAMTPKLALYFDTIETIIAEGRLEECYDVSSYQWDGTDRHGLNLWLRKRGLIRSENMHQKMIFAFGPHGLGAEVGHFLLLMVTYRYNVNTGVRRKGYHDFRMPYHDRIDRIQIRMM